MLIIYAANQRVAPSFKNLKTSQSMRRRKCGATVSELSCSFWGSAFWKFPAETISNPVGSVWNAVSASERPGRAAQHTCSDRAAQMCHRRLFFYFSDGSFGPHIFGGYDFLALFRFGPWRAALVQVLKRDPGRTPSSRAYAWLCALWRFLEPPRSKSVV